MCFSASASFGAGVFLAGIGGVTVLKAKESSQKIFALIPVIFSIQQFSEGFLWLSLTNEKYAAFKEPSMYLFLFFAQVVWPVWVSISIMLLEKNQVRKKILLVLSGAGILLSIELAFFLIFYPVGANVVGHHVMYNIDSPASLGILTSAFYFFTAVVPPFFSTVKKVWWLGIALVISYIITKEFYGDYVISVWCYFAAIISGMVFFIVMESKKLLQILEKSKMEISPLR